jgi:Tol biopolymer transport system component
MILALGTWLLTACEQAPGSATGRSNSTPDMRLATEVSPPRPALAPATPTPTPTPHLTGLTVHSLSDNGPNIIFQSFRNGEDAIYRMRDDGVGQVRLLNGMDPAASPDGKRLAFSQITDGRDTIFLAGGTPSRTTMLTTGISPAWSPDGKRLAFSDVRQGNQDIFVINQDGSGEQQLTHSPEDELNPTWSPDGQRIAFERGGKIVIAGLDGADRAILSPGTAVDSTPAWSPDGQWIAFSSRPVDTSQNGRIDSNDNSQLMMVAITGTTRIPLTSLQSPSARSVWSQKPAWSPDGARLAFESNQAGQWDIWVINRDGSNAKNLTSEVKDSVNLHPGWYKS